MSIRVAVLGATGSIGRQSLQVLSEMKEYGFKIVLLSAYRNSKELVKKFGFDKELTIISEYPSGIAADCRELTGTELLGREEFYRDVDIVINGIGGLSGTAPSMAVLQAGAKLLTANKESVVAFGRRINELKTALSGTIVPLDSEHSAIFQCLLGEEREGIEKLVLTASGGANRDKSKEEIAATTAKECLKHPNWSMGVKVTIDSATLMNKGLELIEAKNLFSIENIDIKIHRQSVVHGAASFRDGSLKVYASKPDMRIPIAYALSAPERYKLSFSDGIGLEALNGFVFEEPDEERFPCLKIAKEAASYNTDRAGAVLCAADDIAVRLYLEGAIGFYDISAIAERALARFAEGKELSDLNDLNSITEEVREYILENTGGLH